MHFVGREVDSDQVGLGQLERDHSRRTIPARRTFTFKLETTPRLPLFCSQHRSK